MPRFECKNKECENLNKEIFFHRVSFKQGLIHDKRCEKCGELMEFKLPEKENYENIYVTNDSKTKWCKDHKGTFY